jgi:hypothetical protein
MEARHEARFSTVRKLAATLGVEPSALAEYLGRPARGDCFAHASRPSFRFAFIALIRVHYGGNCAHAPACGGAASDGATHGGGRISVTKNGAVCAAIAVDEKQRVHIILYGTQGTIGLSPSPISSSRPESQPWTLPILRLSSQRGHLGPRSIWLVARPPTPT